MEVFYTGLLYCAIEGMPQIAWMKACLGCCIKNKFALHRPVLSLVRQQLHNSLIYRDCPSFSILRLTPQLKKVDLDSFPIRDINFQNKTDKAQHDKIVQLVEQMLSAKKQLQSARTDKDRTYYENKCSVLDAQIDKLVYELYGLTKEEIDIIEGSNQ